MFEEVSCVKNFQIAKNSIIESTEKEDTELLAYELLLYLMTYLILFFIENIPFLSYEICIHIT